MFTQITSAFNNGGDWNTITAPSADVNGNAYHCPSGTVCSLHLHSSSTMNNVGRAFSTSSAPGIIMGAGSVSEYLADYDKSDTFLSIDAGSGYIT
jgi:Sortilin, neurotensin receptor 3,